MGVLLVCDMPGCGKTTPAVGKKRRPGTPEGWWWMVDDDNRLTVGCCEHHFVLAQGQEERVRLMTRARQRG